MAYFNHAFQKTFVGTGGFVDSTGGMPTTGLGTGEFSFFDPKTWLTVDESGSTTANCPLVLVSKSIHANDKIGPYHGGYAESVKSKTINPKYVSKVYRVDPCSLQQAQVTVGANYTNYETASCTKEFLCGETYNLRVDIKGSPVLRTLTRNTYYTAAAYTGCCAEGDIAPTAVNPLIVYAQWAYQLLNSPVINPFIQVEVTYSLDGGTNWSELGDGTSSKSNLETLYSFFTNPSFGDAATLAGLIINGAYVDTSFGVCTFYPNDSIIAKLEPVQIYASEVDLNGDPCAFSGLCVDRDNCHAIQGKGFGENIVRDLILTEGYMQQPFYTGSDLRIREITNGIDVTNPVTGIDKNATYYRYYIQHSVPRFNNPTGTFDNDQYLLEIVTDQVESEFETFVQNWLINAGNACILENELTVPYFGCPDYCTPVYPSNA